MGAMHIDTVVADFTHDSNAFGQSPAVRSRG